MKQPIYIAVHQESWQQQLQNAVTSAQALFSAVGLASEATSVVPDSEFPIRATWSFIKRMRQGDPKDPLLLQVLTQAAELEEHIGFNRDPVGELGNAIARPGVIQKYHGRALLMVSSACAVHCRYCFRRHFPYEDNQNSRSQWREALDYIRDDPSISEVILSGGDPLVASDNLLSEIVDTIADIPQIKRLRIHSRLPVVLPDRVTDGLLAAVTRDSLSTVMVVHANHANEIDDSVAQAVSALKEKGITVLNQAVLLAGINDSAEAQCLLSEHLFEAGVLPYYLHLLDKVAGAAHFFTPDETAFVMYEQMRVRLPGYLLPKLVREVEGAEAKVTLR